MLEIAADRANELPANIAQSKRIGVCHSHRPLYTLLSGGEF